MTWQEIQWNGQPRRTLAPPFLVFLGEAATMFATTRALATPTVRPFTATSLRADPLYICNAERLPAEYAFQGDSNLVMVELA